MSIDGNAVIDAFFYILKAVPNTLFMAAVTLVGGIVLGALVAVIRIGHHRILNPILAVWVSFTRSVPAIVQIFIAYYTIPFLMAPVLSAFYGREIKFFDVSPYWTGYILFILFHAAFQSENIRGALLSVPRGQYEAAVAMGLSPFMAYRRIVFPQALTVVLPTFFYLLSSRNQRNFTVIYHQNCGYFFGGQPVCCPVQPQDGALYCGCCYLLGPLHYPDLYF